MKNYLIVGMMVLILLLSVVQAFQIKSMKIALAGNAVHASSTQETQGETYEEMTARMHPDQGMKKSRSSSSNSLPIMVGGC